MLITIHSVETYCVVRTEQEHAQTLLVRRNHLIWAYLPAAHMVNSGLIMSKNTTLSAQNLQLFTPKLDGWRLNLFAIIAVIVAVTAISIQSAVYRSLKSLGARHINQMIIPSLVSVFSFHCKLKLCLFLLLCCMNYLICSPYFRLSST